MNHYRFYWLTGNVDQGQGEDPAQALTLLGYGGGAVRALDFYEELDEGPSEYAWVKNSGWERMTPIKGLPPC